MTTVIYDGNRVVADRFWGTFYGTKLKRIGNNIIGFTGEARYFNRVMDYFQSGGTPPNIGDCEVMVVDTTTGAVRIYDSEMDPVDADFPIAIGSGGRVAQGAMDAGADAVEALHIAATWDHNTKVEGYFDTMEVTVGDTQAGNNGRATSKFTCGCGATVVRR